MHSWLAYKNWAVIGATTNINKFGNKIFQRLIGAGYNVTPITPNHDQVEGVLAYSSIKDLDFVPDVVNFVVNPRIGMRVLDDCIEHCVLVALNE